MDNIWGPESDDEKRYREEYNREHYGPPDSQGNYNKGGPFNSGLFMFPWPIEIGLIGTFIGVLLKHIGII